jgi:hypothetical protein
VGSEGRGEYLIDALEVISGMLGVVDQVLVEQLLVPRHMHLVMVDPVAWGFSLILLFQ